MAIDQSIVSLNNGVRLILIIVALSMVFMCCLGYIFYINNLQSIILRIYYGFFGVILFLGEIKLGPILRCFPFLNNYFGKGFFVLFIGLLMLTEKLNFQLILSIILIVTSFALMILGVVLFYNKRQQLLGQKAQNSQPNTQNPPVFT